jgi:lysophospholipase L1-like esterase
MNVRFSLTLVAAVMASACSSEAAPIFVLGSGGAGGSSVATNDSGARSETGGGSSDEGGGDSAPLDDVAGEIESSAPNLVDASDAKAPQDAKAPADADANLAPKDARADAVAPSPCFIVVLGSSTAAGFGLSDPSTSWAQRYATYLTTTVPGSKLTNLAVSGYTTYQVQPTGTTNPAGRPAVDPAHNITAALALHPDAIIVNLPSNDAAAGVPVADSMANLKTVASKATAAKVLIWVTTSQPRQLAPQGIALITGLRDQIEQQFGERALDFFMPLAAPDSTPLAMYNQGDGIHPNAEGHRLLFEQVRMANLPAVIAKSKSDAGP